MDNRKSIRREDFAFFVARTLEDVILLAEEKAGRKLPRNFAFKWLGRPSSSRVPEDVVVALRFPYPRCGKWFFAKWWYHNNCQRLLPKC